ncbi:MAG: hypothetical protein JWO95_1082 [Verrucomicrobiales bacterium]|nr:hypothetical protein [Verrucomicrobiales bacterium]
METGWSANNQIRTATTVAVTFGEKTMKLLAQITADPASFTDNGIAGFFINLAQHYPWLATTLLAIGALRVLFKPVMALLDGYIKANCSPEEYGRLQHFEAGPIYKWLSFGLDLIGSIKLPTLGIKPEPKE